MILQEEEKLSGVKTALVTVGIFITSSIVVCTRIDFGFLSIVTVFVLLQLFFLDLRKKAIERIFGPTIFSVLNIVILIVLRDHYVLMFLSSAILLMICIYYFVVGYFSYSMILGAITIGLVNAMDANRGLSQAVHLSLYWVINLLIGSIVVLMIDFFYKKWIFERNIPNKIAPVENEKHVFSVKKHLNYLCEKSVFSYRAVIISLRVTATVVSLLLVNRAMGWSFIDIQAVIAGIIISAQPSIAMTYRRTLMRMLGVISGAGIAIFFAYFLQSYPSLFLTIILMTVSLGMLTWVSERYRFFEYAFLQAGVMIPLILITSNQEVINVHLAVERSLGSLEGGLVGIAMVYASYFLKRIVSGTHL